MKKLPWFSWARLALLAGATHFLISAGIGLSRHWGYLSSLNDLGVYDQAVWSLLSGTPFLNTSNALGLHMNWLGFHFNPIVLVFAPLYLVYPAAEWLIVLQAAAISITAWPLFLFARRVLQSEHAAFLWAVVFLVNPFVLNAAVWDFHPVSLAAPLMAFGVLAIEKRDPWLFGLSCMALLIVQEQFGMAVAGFGVLWGLRNRSMAPAIVTLCMGIAHTALVFGVIMPAFSPTGSHLMTSDDLGQLSRYAWLGDSLEDAAHQVLFHPLAIAKQILFDSGGLQYLVLLLAPLLATPLVGIEFLIPAVADLSANLLSANPMPRSVFSYHSISLMPMLLMAGIYGSFRIALWWHRYAPIEIAKLVLWGTALLGYFMAPLPMPFSFNYWKPIEWAVKPEKAVHEIRVLIPPGASVSAQGNVGAHFSQRSRIYHFPIKKDEVDFIVLRVANPTKWRADQESTIFGSLAHHLGMLPGEYLVAVEQLLADRVYGVVYWNKPWIVLSKRAKTSEFTQLQVNSHLAKTAEEWGIQENVSSSVPLAKSEGRT